MENCIRPDVITGYIDLHAIGNSNDIWQALSRTKHGSRIANDYINAPVGNNNSSIDGIIRSCTDVYDVITNSLNNIGANHLDQPKNSLGLSAQMNMEQILGSSASMTFNYQQNGSNLLKQSMMVNAFNDSYMTVAQATGVDASALGYGIAKAQEVSRLNSTMSGIMAKKYLPLAKSYLTIIFIVIIPLIFLIALATGTIKKPIGMIVMMLMAISLWGVGEQILDYIILIRTNDLYPANAGLQSINLVTQPAVDQAILDTLSLSYGIYWMIPTLAIAIASMSGYAAANMMGGISGKVTSGVGSAASEAATGSASYGVVRADMINTNKYDTTQSMGAGLSTSVVNNNKEEMLNSRTRGHEYTSKNNTIDEDIWKQTYSVNITTKGDVTINGQTGAGEHNQKTIANGDVVNYSAVSGSSETENVNVRNTNAGVSLIGQNAGDELLNNGIYAFASQSEQNQHSFLKNITDKNNAYVSKTGTDSIKEAQDLAAKLDASASAGLNILGSGFKVGAGGSVSAALGHSSENMSRADLNMAAGLFNVNGQFSEEKYNEAAQIRYGTYNAMVTGEISNVYGPGNLSSEAFDAIKGNLEKVDKVLTDHAKDRLNNSNFMGKP